MKVHPGDRMKRARADWVYVGVVEAAALVGVSEAAVRRAATAGELTETMLVKTGRAGSPRVVYRLDQLLAMAKRNGR